MSEGEEIYASKLREIIENKDSFHLDIKYSQMREVLSEIFTQVDSMRKTAKQFQQMESSFLTPADITPMQQQMEKLNEKIEQQTSDFSNELKEIRAYFTFQMKDLNAKVDNGMASVISELSKPVSPVQTPVTQEAPPQFAVQDQTLRSDFEMLKERFETLLESLQSQHDEDEANREEEEEEMNEEEQHHEGTEEGDAKSTSRSQKSARSQANEDDENKSTSRSQRSQKSARSGTKTPTNEETEFQTPDSKKQSESALSPETPLSSSRLSPDSDKKDRQLRKVYELAITDLKVQLKNLVERTHLLEDNLSEKTPIINQMRADIEAFSGDVSKNKADIILIKAELQRLNDSNSSSLAEAMKEINKTTHLKSSSADGKLSADDVEKSIKAVRVQCAQQIASLENNMSEEMRKIRADIAGLKSQQSNLQSDFQDIKNAPPPPFQFQPPPESEEKPKAPLQEAENAVMERSLPEPDNVVIERSLPGEGQSEEIKPDENQNPQSPRQKIHIETQTENDPNETGLAVTTTQTVNMPNQLISTVIYESSSSDGDKKKQLDVTPGDITIDLNKEEQRPSILQNKEVKLALWETTSFNYDLVAPPEELENLHTIVEKQQELINGIFEQLDKQDKAIKELDDHKLEIEQPDEPQLQIAISTHDDAILEIKKQLSNVSDGTDKNTKDIDDINDRLNQMKGNVDSLNESFTEKINNIQSDLNNIPKVTAKEAPQPKKEIEDYGDNVKKIILTPVSFSALYVAPLPVFSLKPQKNTKIEQQQTPSKKEIVEKKVLSNKKPQTTRPQIQKKLKEGTPAKKDDQTKQKPKVTIPQTKQKETPVIPQLSIKPHEEEDVNNKQVSPEPSPLSVHSNRVKISQNTPKSAHPEQDIDENIESPESQRHSSVQSAKGNASSRSHHSGRSVHSSHSTRSNHSTPSAHSTRSNQSTPSQHSTHSRKSTHRSEEEPPPKSPLLSHHSSSRKSTHRSSGTNEMQEEEDIYDEQSQEEEEENVETPVREDIEEKLPNQSTSTLHTSPNSSVADFQEEEARMMEDEIPSTSRSEQKERMRKIQLDIEEHRDQLRILRNAIVDIRNHIQELSIKLHQNDNKSDTILTQFQPLPPMPEQQNNSEALDSAIRALRKRMDIQNKAVTNDVLGLKQELFDLKKALDKTNDELKLQSQLIAQPIQYIPRDHSDQPLQPKSLETEKTEEKKEPEPKVIKDFPKQTTMMKITPLKLPALPPENTTVTPPIVDPVKPSLSQRPVDLPVIVNQPQKQIPPQSKSELPSPKKNKLTIDDTVSIPDIPPAPTTPDPNNRRIFTNVVPQQVEDLNILNASENIDKEVLQLLIDVRAQLQNQIDQNTVRLNQMEEKAEQFVDKEYIGKFYSKMRVVINETNAAVEQIKQTTPDKVNKEDLRKAMEDLYAALSRDESTSGGTTSYRCLLCGRPKAHISGMIMDRAVAESLGDPTQSVVAGNGPQRGNLLYGPDKQVYKGRGNFGRPTTSKIEERKLPTLEK